MSAGAEHLKVREVATLRQIKQATVLSWIASGELCAVDCSAKPNGRPRWRISHEALASFDAKRQSRPAPTVKRIRKRKQQTGVIQFF